MTLLLWRLAEALGAPMPADPADAHERWRLYRKALPVPSAHDALREAVAADPDPSLAAAVVTAMMERTALDSRAAWLALPRNERDRAYAARRAREADLLSTGGAGADPDPDAWSDWLQLRLAATSTVDHVLDLLATRGRTKRIRTTAARRLARPNRVG